MTKLLVITIIIIIALLTIWIVNHQQSLRRRAELMQDAVQNHDFTFRLPTNGMLPGERAMQEALNQMGNTIRQQVSQNEVESWERLTRVLTHEIMNSTAPITSISQAMLEREDVKGTSLEEGIRAIHSTSQHLTTFVDSYRKFSHLQQPSPEDVLIAPLLSEIQQLYPTLTWLVDVPDGLLLHTDSTMLRQIIINLAKNAQEAGAKRFEVKASANHVLLVSNDGQPIPAEARSSIFVPFFTTKRTGSGIGLSLSRRMMTLQGGSLELADRPQSGYSTSFQLAWNER